MKRILFTTDFSDASINAFDYLKGLISNFPITVDIMHVYDIPVNITTSIPPRAIDGMIDAKNEASNVRLEKLQKQLINSHKGELVSLYGPNPSIEIAEAATNRKIDLIVMATKKSYGPLDRIFGSTTVHVIEKSDIPILAIPAETSYRPIKNVLFPTTTSQISELSQHEIDAIVWVHEFLGIEINPKINIVHITNKPDVADISLKHFPLDEMNFSISHSPSIEEGILNYLSDDEMSILAIYKPHRGFWSGLFHASVTNKLLYKSKIPLLVF